MCKISPMFVSDSTARQNRSLVEIRLRKSSNCSALEERLHIKKRSKIKILKGGKSNA